MWKDTIADLQKVNADIAALQEKKKNLFSSLPSRAQIDAQTVDFKHVNNTVNVSREFSEEMQTDVKIFMIDTDSDSFLIYVIEGDWRDEVCRPSMSSSSLIALYSYIAESEKSDVYSSIVSDPKDAIAWIKERDKENESFARVLQQLVVAKDAFENSETAFTDAATASKYKEVAHLLADITKFLEVLNLYVRRERIGGPLGTTEFEKIWVELKTHLITTVPLDQTEKLTYNMATVDALVDVLKEEKIQ